MPRTSASCPAPKRRSGFTLLELLVVLVLLALVSGLVLPRMAAWLSGAEERAWRGALREQLANLPVQTYRSGQAQTVDAQWLRQAVPTVPQDVQLDVPKPLRYGANGLAGGGKVLLQRPHQSPEVWQILPLTGEVRIDPVP